MNRALNILSLFSSGTLIVSSGGSEMLSLRISERKLNIDVASMKRADIRLQDLASAEKGINAFKDLREVASTLFELGWKLTIYDGASSLANIGFGVSRLTGHISVNPLKLRSLLESSK